MIKNEEFLEYAEVEAWILQEKMDFFKNNSLRPTFLEHKVIDQALLGNQLTIKNTQLHLRQNEFETEDSYF